MCAIHFLWVLFMVKHLNDAINFFGSQTALAKAIGLSQPYVQNWLRRGKVPADKCIAIEQATNGLVSRFDLRPDIFCSTDVLSEKGISNGK